MIDSQHETTTEPAPARRPWWRKRPAQITIAVIAVWGAISIWAFTGGSTAAPVHVRGSINLGFLASTDTTDPNATITGSDLIQAGDACQASSDYDDIAPGTTVTIGGSNGQPIGVGALGTGTETAGGYCGFAFDVTVPGGQSAYTVTISHRGTTTFTPAQVESGILLTLGD